MRPTGVPRALVIPAIAAILLAPVASGQLLPPAGGNDGPQAERPVASQGRAVFEIDRLRHGFGRILDTDPVTTEFAFRNTGDDTLVIYDIHSTCGCTAADLDKLQYAPGEGAVLPVTFKPKGKMGPSHQRVTIRTNDPVNPVTVLTISATVERVVYAEPALANMGAVHKGGTQDQLISVYGRTSDFEVTDITVIGSEFFTADIIGTEAEEIDGETLRRTDIVVSLKPGAAPGHLSAVATARTNDPRQDVLNIQLAARIEGDIALSPNRIAFGRIGPGASTEFPVLVRNMRGEPFKILGLEEQSNLDSKVEYRVEPVDPEKRDAYRVTFIFRGNSAEGAVRGRLQLKTDVPLEELVDLTFLGRIVAAGEEAGVTITDGRDR
ncbi:MAG: DUF1573 domain-containing protein [Phycisphaerales bacterium JB039]